MILFLSWCYNKNNIEIVVKFFNTYFKKRLLQAIDDLQKEANPDEDLIGTVDFIINKQLTYSTFKDCMIKELQSMYLHDDVDEWLNIRDRFNHMLGSEDSVYDFNIRPGEPKDRVAMSTGFTQKQVAECNMTVQNRVSIIVAALEGMHNPETKYSSTL